MKYSAAEWLLVVKLYILCRKVMILNGFHNFSVDSCSRGIILGGGLIVYIMVPYMDLALLRKTKAVPQHTYGGAWGERSYSSYSFTTSAIDGVSGQRHAPAALYSRVRTPGIRWGGGWMGLRAGLDTEGRGKILFLLPGIELRSSGLPVRSKTLY
jgi:hypothetical protein